MAITSPTRSWSQVMRGERLMSGPAQEVAQVLVVRRRHLLGGAEEGDALFVQHGDPRRHAEHGPDVVRDDDAGDVELALELHDEPRDGAGAERIEAGRRL